MSRLCTIWILLPLFSSFAPASAIASAGSQVLTKIESLKNLIDTTGQDTTKAKALIALSWEVKYSNPDTAILLCNKALTLFGKYDDQRGMAKSQANLGVYYYLKSDFATALDYHFKALDIRKKQNDLKGMAGSYNNIGIIYKNQSDYPQALVYYFRSLKIKEELLTLPGGESNKQGIALSYNNIGNIYKSLSNYPEALSYYFKTLKISEELGKQQSMAASYTNIGSVYTDIYQLKPTSLDDSLAEKVGKWAFQNPAKLLDTSMYYQQKAFAIQEKLNDEYWMALSLANIGTIHKIRGNYTEAINYYTQAELLSESLGALNQQSHIHRQISLCYGKLNNHQQALNHYKQYSTLKDSVFNEEKSKDLGKLEAKHEFETAEAERKRLEEESRAASVKADQRRNNLQYSGILIFLVLVFAGVFALGRISIPVRLAEGLVFFSFLLFFEFTLVLLDPYIEQYSSGAPAVKLAFNAVLAGLIFPLHSFFESKLKTRLVKQK